MSLTKQFSPDECGTPEEEFWRGYEDWSDSLDEATGETRDFFPFEDRECVPHEELNAS